MERIVFAARELKPVDLQKKESLVQNLCMAVLSTSQQLLVEQPWSVTHFVVDPT